MADIRIRIIRTVCLLVFGGLLVYSAVRQMGLKTDSRITVVQKDADEEVTNYHTLSEKELLVLAYDGDSTAAYHLGLLYDYGLMDTSQSFERAKQWYETADMAGVPEAACALGYLYLNGCGVKKDPDTSEAYFDRSIREGYTRACVGLGRLALDRSRQEKSKKKRKALEAEAYEAAEKAAAEESADGLYFLGYLKEKGIGTKEDTERAVDLYNRTLKASLGGEGDEEDLRNAKGSGDEDSSIALEDRYAYNNANTRLGLMYMDGRGVDEDMNAARNFFQKAADNGYAMAQYYMGIVYDMGYGVREDYDEALRWFELAAQQDYAPALNQIGYMYFMGKGVAVDYSQAVYYQKLSAALGYPKAQVNLGYLYENGYGVERNYESALSYYKMASEANYKGAREAVIRVQNLMNKKSKK